MSGDIVSALPTFNQLTSSRCDDFVDRLNHVYTVYLLVVLTVLISTVQYVGSPISCAIPYDILTANKDFSSYEDYVHKFCWLKNTYYIPIYDHIDIPKNIDDKKQEEITYYQWVPIILSTQTLLFKLPHIFWKTLQGSSGVDIENLCKHAEVIQLANCTERKQAFQDMVFTFENWIRNVQFKTKCNRRIAEQRGRVLRWFCYFNKDGEAKFLTVLFVAIKVIYLANALMQMFLLNEFISGTGIYGLQWMQSLQSEVPVDLTKGYLFPRVTMCDILVRQLNNAFTYTMQCVLPINIFNEKIFLFQWFWLGIVAVLSLLNMTKWLFLLVYRRNNCQFVKKFLKEAGAITGETDKVLSKKFAENYLGNDGCFAARMIALNSSDKVVIDMLTVLFGRYRNNEMRILRLKALPVYIPPELGTRTNENKIRSRKKKKVRFLQDK